MAILATAGPGITDFLSTGGKKASDLFLNCPFKKIVFEFHSGGSAGWGDY